MIKLHPLTPLSRLCLRRAAFRALSSSPSSSISIKARSLTSLTYPLTISRTSTLQKATFFPLQRRYATDEAATQAEPEADGATEAQHGENSIAASADADADANTPEPATQHEEAAAQSTIESATESARDQASSAGSQVGDAARTATETVKGAAESLAAAAGFGPGPSQAGSRTEGSEGKDGEPSKNVYVGNLFFDVRTDDLKREFSSAGEIVNAKIITDQRGLSKGYVLPLPLRPAFPSSLTTYTSPPLQQPTLIPHPRFGYIEFATVEAATKAISLYHLQNFEGRRLTVQYSLSNKSRGALRAADRGTPAWSDRPIHPATKTLFIGNMSFDMSDRDLNNLFREVKNVVDVRVAIDRRTGQPRGFAHADFIDVKSAEAAAEELRGKVVCGRALRVDFSLSTGRSGTTGGGVATGVDGV